MDQLEIKSYVHMVKRRWWLIALCVIIAYTVTSIYYSWYVKPVYQASAKLIINQSEETSPTMLPGQINANLMLINTYKEIILTTAVMGRVVDQYPDLQLRADQLINRVRVSSVNDSQVMTISVTDLDYDRAMMIVNAVAAVVKEAVPQIMKVNNVEILDTALPDNNPTPIGSDPMVSKIISVIAAMMIGVALIFLAEFLDDSIKSEKDVMHLGLPVVATIGKIKEKDLVQKKRRQKKKFREVPYATVNE